MGKQKKKAKVEANSRVCACSSLFSMRYTLELSKTPLEDIRINQFPPWVEQLNIYGYIWIRFGYIYKSKTMMNQKLEFTGSIF